MRVRQTPNMSPATKLILPNLACGSFLVKALEIGHA